MISKTIFIALLAVSSFLLENIYFRIADRFNIIDKPNERSSHSEITIRGGGIVFLFAGIFYAFYSSFAEPYFIIGFLLISILSLADDIFTLSSKVRLPIQLFAVALLVFQVLGVESLWWLWLVSLVLATGIINAYNFMDGINGITAGYSLVVLSSLLVLNQSIHFTDDLFIWSFIVADLIFGYYNFREKAKCFAGDVGSVSIAFVIVYLLSQLIFQTNNLFFILLLAVYGVDSVLTIVYRLKKGENIFEAHRSHLYQWMVKPGPFTHLQMSGLYMFFQVLISAGVIYLAQAKVPFQVAYSVAVLIGLGALYIVIKALYRRKHALV